MYRKNLEEMSRNPDGLLVRKEIYFYIESIVNFRTDLKKMQSMDRKLKSTWDYKYSKENELVEIIINHYSPEGKSKTEEGITSEGHPDRIPMPRHLSRSLVAISHIRASN